MKFKKRLLSLAALSAMTINTNATELPSVSGIPVAESLTVLPLNDMGKSFVFDALEDRFEIQAQSSTLSTSLQKNPVLTTLESYDAVLLDAQYYPVDDKTLKRYLKAAQVQSKIIIIENANQLPEGALDDVFTAMLSADIVVLHPSNSAAPDVFYTYDAQRNEPKQKLILADSQRENLSSGNFLPEQSSSTESKDLVAPLIPETNLNSMSGEHRSVILADVIENIMAERRGSPTFSNRLSKSNKKPGTDEAQVGTLNVGSDAPYTCPQVVYDAQRCRTFAINTLRYDWDIYGIVFSGVAFVDYTMFKDRFDKFIGVKVSGIASPTLTTDNTVRKEFFLSATEVNVDVREGVGYPNLSLFRRAPLNDNDTTTLISSTGLTVGIDATGGVSGSNPGLSVHASASYNTSNTVRRSIDDWQVNVHSPQNRDVSWRFQTLFPSVGGSKDNWIHNPGVCCKARINDIKPISKYGQDYTTEAIFRASSNENKRAQFFVDVDYEATSVYFTHQGRNVNRSDIAFTTYDLQGPITLISLDLNWLQ